MTLKRFELGSAPVPYIREALALGHQLATALLSLRLEDGTVHALLPEQTTLENVTNFEEGSVAPTTWTDPHIERIDRGEIDSAEAAFVYDYLGQTESIAIFEHPLASASGNLAAVVPDGSQYFANGDDLYLFLTHDSRDIDVITATMRTARGYYSVGVLVRDHGFPISPTGEVSVDLLTSIASAADHILVGAYDGEADLIWSRK